MKRGRGIERVLVAKLRCCRKEAISPRPQKQRTVATSGKRRPAFETALHLSEALMTVGDQGNRRRIVDNLAGAVVRSDDVFSLGKGPTRYVYDAVRAGDTVAVLLRQARIQGFLAVNPGGMASAVVLVLALVRPTNAPTSVLCCRGSLAYWASRRWPLSGDGVIAVI